MVWTSEKGRGGVLGEVGKLRVHIGGYELVGNGGACGTQLIHVESSHCPSNPILDGKI